MVNVLYCAAVGFWLATLQVAIFLGLQLYLSSTIQSYMVLMLAWLGGAALGVFITRPRTSGPLILLSGLSPYAVQALLERCPYDTSWLPLHGLLIGLTALFAGQFFQEERVTFRRFGVLLQWELAGFILGLLGSVVAAMLWGRWLLAVCPGAGLLAVGGLYLIKSPGRSKPGPSSRESRTPPPPDETSEAR